MKDRIYRLMFLSDLEGTRFMLSAGAILVGLGFLWPVETFPTMEQIRSGTGRHTYAIMAIIAGERAWGVAFLLHGVVAIYSLIFEVRNRLLLWIDGVAGVLIWTVSILSCYMAYWRGFDRVMEYSPPAIMGLELAGGVLASWWILVRYWFDDKKGKNAGR